MSTPAPAQRAATPAPAAGQAGQQEESALRKFISIGQQMFIIYVITQVAGKFFSSKTPTPPAAVSPGGVPAAIPAASVNPFLLPPAQIHPEWPLNIPVSMHVYLTTDSNGQVFERKGEDASLPHFVWHDISLGDWGESRTVEYDIKIPESVQHNASLWADIFLTKNQADPNPTSPRYSPASVHHVRKLLTRYMPKPKVRKEHHLLSAKGEKEEETKEEVEPDVVASFWHQNLTLAVVSDSAVIQYANLAAPVAEHIHLVPGKRDQTGTMGYYQPIIFPNEFWHLRSQYTEINTTTPTLPLQIVFQPMSYFKYQLFASMSFGFQEAVKQQGGSSGAEIDELKRMLVETNPWFLGLTGLVSLLHMLFELLAFKNDVSHWKNRQELVGVSVRSIVTNVFVQLIILLYLIDNNTDTSWMILFGSGTGLLIEAWKITKAVDIKIVSSPAGSKLPWTLAITDKHVLSEDEKKTQEYDKLAFRYVSWVTIPSLAIYAVYSLIYDSHRGWYSFVISTLTSFVYMFGFAQLVPQLIINYKLKSVAHMPMKSMVYKTLSTVIDDLFAFIIKMPILHRLACFRDDVVFLIFLYQRWIYRIDPKRINEYGQVLESEEEKKQAETKKTQ
ncbi:cleft lip and palate associated transmembrane protein [Auriscalpium vulgare]|uniref:Cleft lip and palate associated transmembrane protein n=1 Tax=Auriscalpium vulgare TaxID=40419 RepID=A0ACB8SAU6_9AGAM|nr:cleft lip and palate associated transmembrane protein [Auriscalpium vulgare]